MCMAAILFNDTEPFEQSVNITSKEGPMWNLVKKIGQVDSVKNTFKDFIVLYLYITQGPAKADNLKWGKWGREGRGGGANIWS